MKHHLAALLLLLSLPALAGPLAFQETGVALTGSAPTTSTDGVNLLNVSGWRVIASAALGATFTSGYLDCYFRSAKLGRWMPCPAALNITLVAGQRDSPIVDNETLVGLGRLKYVGRDVVMSDAAATFIITYELSRP